MKSKLPILILAYNRPDLVAQVMQVIQTYQPPRLYLACDGPREQKQRDTERVAETRQAMTQAVIWPCETYYLFREQNLGCAKGVYEAITWFFEHEEYGVIIEDDVIVSQDFFKLCEDLLPRYRNEERIMQIASRNTSRRMDISNTYVYSQTFHCWGWATWKRAWNKMDMKMSNIDNTTVTYLLPRLGLFRALMTRKYFLGTYRILPKSNSWAIRWFHSIISNDGLVICPGVNLGINIGATSGEHYAIEDAKSPAFKYELQSLDWPIEYNDTMSVDKEQKKYDSRFYFRERLYGLIYKKIGFRWLF